MALNILLCEAAHDENGQLGYETHKKGDQTRDEVRNYNYYNKPWSYVFRWKNDAMREAFAVRMQQAVDNAHIGYGQPARLDYFYALQKIPNYDPSKITTDVDCDCSALLNANVYFTLLSCGVKTAITGHETTALMPNAYKNSSMFFEDVTSQIDLATGNGLQKGDILVKPMSHTASVWSVYDDAPKADTTETATTTTGETTTALYLRKGLPTFVNGKKTLAGAVCVMPKGATVEILERHMVENTVVWFKVKYATYTGYCNSTYIK